MLIVFTTFLKILTLNAYEKNQPNLTPYLKYFYIAMIKYI